MRRTDRDVDEFLAGLDGPRAGDLRVLDAAIRERMPDHARHLYEGTFWGGSEQAIIGYGLSDYENRSGQQVRWFVVGLAEQKNHVSVYVNAVVDGRYLLRDYEGKLGKAKVGSASIGFRSLNDVDLTALLDLVERAGRSEPPT